VRSLRPPLRLLLSELRKRSMTNMLKTISPADNRVYVERPLTTSSEIERALSAARRRRRCGSTWRSASGFPSSSGSSRLRGEIGGPRRGDLVARWGGRSSTAGRGEGLAERARYMAGIAVEALADLAVEPKTGFTRSSATSPRIVSSSRRGTIPISPRSNAVVPRSSPATRSHSQSIPSDARFAPRRFAEAFRPPPGCPPASSSISNLSP